MALSGPFGRGGAVRQGWCRGEPYQPYQPYQCRSGAVRLVFWYGLSRTGGGFVGRLGHLVEGLLVRLKPYRVEMPYRP